MILTESQKKMLTEFLGECWHHKIRQPKVMGEYVKCLDCGETWDWLCDTPPRHSFLTWPDLGACMEALVKEGLWDGFRIFVDNTYIHSHSNPNWSDFIAWLFRPVNEAGEPHFCALVAEFLEARDGQKP